MSIKKFVLFVALVMVVLVALYAIGADTADASNEYRNPSLGTLLAYEILEAGNNDLVADWFYAPSTSAQIKRDIVVAAHIHCSGGYGTVADHVYEDFSCK